MLTITVLQYSICPDDQIHCADDYETVNIMSSVIDDARRAVALAMAVREMDGVVETWEEDGEAMV